MKILLPILFVCLFGITDLLVAQDIIFSTPQKIPTRITDYDILGKTPKGIVVYKWGERDHILEWYNEDLKLSQTRDLVFEDKRVEVLNIIPYAKEFVVLFTTRQKKQLLGYARRLDANLKPIGEDILLFKQDRKVGGRSPSFSVKLARNRQYISIFKSNYDFNGVTDVDVLVLNRELSSIDSTNIELKDKHIVRSTFINNEGNIGLVQAKPKRTLLSNTPQVEHLEFFLFDRATKTTKTVLIEKSDFLLNDLAIEPDDRNNRIVVSGFYSEKQANESKGYFYVFVDLDTYSLSQQEFKAFDKDFIKKVYHSRTLTGKLRGHINNLEIKKVIPRQDGGALLMGEVQYTSSRTVGASSYYSLYQRDFSQVTSYFHDDIIVLSINPDGGLLWSKVLKKKQQSEQDEGYFSSFGMVNSRQAVHLIFNETVSFKSTMSQYVLQSDGAYKIASLLNLGEYQLKLAPRYGKQVSANEVVIPGFNNRNQFLLSKVTF